MTRIWAGDKLIASLRSSDHARANHPKYRFRIYLGTEDQQPDPLLKKHVPANAAPAHRGLVYLLFEDLPLDECRPPTGDSGKGSIVIAITS